jgi:hypothetical protein
MCVLHRGRGGVHPGPEHPDQHRADQGGSFVILMIRTSENMARNVGNQRQPASVDAL